MNCKRCMKILTVLVLAAAPVCAAFAGGNLSWKEVLEYANRKVDNKGSASVLGVAVGEQVRRISLHAKETKRLEDFYQSLRRQGTPEYKIRKCQANYQMIKKDANSNELFANYALTADSFQDFCNLSPEELRYVKLFFRGRVAPAMARKYSDTILLVLTPRSSMAWLSVNPQDKMIKFTCNNAANFKSLEVSHAQYTPLSVN